jgi:hypothetical protein
VGQTMLLKTGLSSSVVRNLLRCYRKKLYPRENALRVFVFDVDKLNLVSSVHFFITAIDKYLIADQRFSKFRTVFDCVFLTKAVFCNKICKLFL